MKLTLLALSLFLFSASSFAAETYDITVKGSVQKAVELPTMTELFIQNIEIVSAPEIITSRMGIYLQKGMMVAVRPVDNIVASDCKNAELTLRVGEGNVLPFPDGRESYRSPVVLSFRCDY